MAYVIFILSTNKKMSDLIQFNGFRKKNMKGKIDRVY